MYDTARRSHSSNSGCEKTIAEGSGAASMG